MRTSSWILLLAVPFSLAAADDAKSSAHPAASPLPPLPIHEFVPNDSARGVIVFGSGDGGWTNIEQRLCGSLARRGWYIAGLDFSKYAGANYDQQQLARDLASLAQYGLAHTGNFDLPIVYAGWSMGAEQSVAAAAVPAAWPANLRGLLLISPGKRGRYGLRFADTLGIPPSGAGTFALSNFQRQLGSLRIAQIHGGFDPLDSTGWLDGLASPHRKWVVPNGWHDLADVSDSAVQIIGQALEWICDRGSEQ
jgi:hypothetical protein